VIRSCYAQQDASRTAEYAETAESVLVKFSARFAFALSAVKVRKVSDSAFGFVGLSGQLSETLLKPLFYPEYHVHPIAKKSVQRPEA